MDFLQVSRPDLQGAGIVRLQVLSALESEDSVRAAVNEDSGARWTAYAFGALYFLRRNYPRQMSSGANMSKST